MGTTHGNGRSWAVALLAVAALAWRGAGAATITFDFNALTDGRGNAEVQTYMQGVLAAAGFGADAVTIAGAKASKVDAGKGVDAFLVNAGTGTISITFGAQVYGVRFDYELIADVQCTNGSNAHNCVPAAFNFVADSAETFYVSAAAAGAGDKAGRASISMKKSDGTVEAAPDAWGASGWWEFPQGATRLEFRNVAGSAGIDNLQVAAVLPAVAVPIPAPATVALIGLGLAGLGYARWRKSA